MKRFWRWFPIFAALTAGPLFAVPPLVRLPGPAGCISALDTGGECVHGSSFFFPTQVVVTPDGRAGYLLASAVGTNAIVAFDRDRTSGILTAKVGAALCISDNGSGGICADGVELVNPTWMVMSADGRHAYVATEGSSAITVFDRNVATSQLTQKVGAAGCINETASVPPGCALGRALSGAHGIAISPDDRNVYAASRLDDAIVIFDRDVTTGVLTQKAGAAGCVDEAGGDGCADGKALSAPRAITISPDGRHVYVASSASNAVAVFDRDVASGVLTQKVNQDGCVSDTGTAGSCADGTALLGPRDVTVSGNGATVYVALTDGDAVAIFDRDEATGVLTQKAAAQGCVSLTGTGGSCTVGRALDGAQRIAVSGDGRSVYVASFLSEAVSVFDRDASTGSLTQKTGLAGCISESGTGGTCTDGVVLEAAWGVTVSPDSRHVYVTSGNSHAVVAFTREVPVYDIDGNGEVDPLEDGLLLLRFVFGFTGSTLIGGAIDLSGCTRCTAPLIEAYIAALLAP